MKLKLRQICFLIIGLLIFNLSSFSQEQIPSPKLTFIGTEDYENGQILGKTYLLSVENRTEFPNEMFEPAPDLPPCGKNTKSSRTWIDIFGSGNKRLYGFCGIKSNSELNRLFFTLPNTTKPPKFVYIVITDRKTKMRYSSNVIELKID